MNPLWRTPRNPRIYEEVALGDLLVRLMTGIFGRGKKTGFRVLSIVSIIHISNIKKGIV